jgi:hypothetical protein
MRAVGIENERSDVFNEPRTLEQLLGERPRRSVERRHEKQPLLGVARDDAWQQAEVIVDDVWVNRLRRDVDHARPRLPEQQQQKQIPLFVRLLLDALNRRIDVQRRDDDDGLRVFAELLNRSPQRDELALKGFKLIDGFHG